MSLFVRRMTLVLFALCLSIAAAKSAPKPKAEPAPEAKPWTLRDYFTIKYEKSDLWYDAETAEWRLMTKEEQPLLDGVRASITLADGTVLAPGQTTEYATGRDIVTNEFGTGYVYSMASSPRAGLKFKHTLHVMNDHPIVLVQFELFNESDAAVEVSQITPVKVPAQASGPTVGDGRLRQRRLVMRGTTLVHKSGAPALYVLDQRGDLSIAMGFLPLGVADSAVRVDTNTGQWPGEFTSTFSPPLTLAPGKSVASDPVWLSFTTPTPSEIDFLYAWTHSVSPLQEKQNPAPKGPDAWLTAWTGASADELLQVLGEWKGAGIEHALIPDGWEGIPGSYDGAAPTYPRNIGELAKAIKKMKYNVGLTIDPLAVTGGDEAWVFIEESGVRWVNPTVEAAREHAAKQVQRAVRGTFSFLVVKPSEIPDAALNQFGITRVQADTAAFGIAKSGLGSSAVTSAAAGDAELTLDGLLGAAGDTGRLREYHVAAGPLRIPFGQNSTLDEEAISALSLHGGPIEYVGVPEGSVRRKVAKLHPRPSINARPVDFTSDAPKLWFLQRVNNNGQAVSGCLAAFSGAPTHNVESLELKFDGPISSWKPSDGSLLENLKR